MYCCEWSKERPNSEVNVIQSTWELHVACKEVEREFAFLAPPWQGLSFNLAFAFLTLCHSTLLLVIFYNLSFNNLAFGNLSLKWHLIWSCVKSTRFDSDDYFTAGSFYWVDEYFTELMIILLSWWLFYWVDDYFTEGDSFLQSQSRGYKSTWCGLPQLRLWSVISDFLSDI